MDRAAIPVPQLEEVPFCDRLGERRRTTDAAGVVRELLRIRPELTQVPAFEFALRERVARLADFRHPYFAHARSVERLVDGDATLGLVSDRLEGFRLATLFSRAASRGLNLDINAAVCLMRQIVPAIARFHEACRDVAHGALGPERVVLTSNGRLMVTEYVLGAALEQLRYSQERYWRELRIAVPRSVGLPQFDERTDVTQIGIIALSLVLGRTLREDEYPGRIVDVVNSAKAISPRGGFESLAPGLRTWIMRALQLDVRHSFQTVRAANDELERVLAEIEYPGLPASVEAFLIRYHEADFAAAMAPGGAAAREPRSLEEFPAEQDLRLTPRVELAAVESPLDAFVAEPPPAPKPAVAAAQPSPGLATPSVRSSAPERRDAAPAVPTRDLFATPPAPAAGRWKMAMAVGLVLATGAAYGPLARRFRTPPPATPSGTLVVRTPHPGTTVMLDGRGLGLTPLSATVVAGPHTLELLSAGITKTVPVTITGGARVEQYIEMPMASPADASPPRAANEPAVAPRTPAASSVRPEVASQAAAPVRSDGWLSMQAPIDLAIEAGGRPIGSSGSGPLALPAGSHELTLRNDSLGYRATRTVTVTGGKATSVIVDVPDGLVAVNALPWADVWIDGVRVGETPIGNLALPIGTHDVLLRHPEHGERHHAVTVTTSGVARVSVDLRR